MITTYAPYLLRVSSSPYRSHPICSQSAFGWPNTHYIFAHGTESLQQPGTVVQPLTLGSCIHPSSGLLDFGHIGVRKFSEHPFDDYFPAMHCRSSKALFHELKTITPSQYHYTRGGRVPRSSV